MMMKIMTLIDDASPLCKGWMVDGSVDHDDYFLMTDD